jgi:hypothetical protein
MTEAPMTEETGPVSGLRRKLAAGVSLAGAVAGLLYGYDFGDTLSGPWTGVVAASSFGIFGAMLLGSFADYLLGLAKRR